MKWYCLKCGRKNDQTDDNCSKCGLDQESAISYPVTYRRRSCEECGHIHREGVFCHVYTEAGDDDLDNDYLSEEEEQVQQENEDSIDNDFLEEEGEDTGARPQEDTENVEGGDEETGGESSVVVETKPKYLELQTPEFVKAIRYIRCNCDVGVPNDCKKFEPIPGLLVIGKIAYQTYHEIMEPDYRRNWEEYNSLRRSEDAAIREANEKEKKLAEQLPHVLSFLPYGIISPVPAVCRLWNYGVNLYKAYTDMRDCVPYQVFRPHAAQADSVVVFGDKIYSGGDRRVFVSSLSTGEKLSMVTRDSGDIPRLLIREGMLFICSTNGSIRTYGLTHTGQNLKLISTMWDHTRAITDALACLPSIGVCEAHGIDNHVCFMYTCSEDRTIKLWNLVKMTSFRSVSTNALRSASFTRLAQSNRHLFAGTSVGTVAIFNKSPLCEREDVHACTVPHADSSYCLQLSLKLPDKRTLSGNPPIVTGLLCPRIGPEFPTLWATDNTGQLTIWYVPPVGLEFTPAYTIKAHPNSSITQLIQTWRHVITVGDDCVINLYDVISFARVRRIDIMEWGIYRSLFTNQHIRRRLKSVAVLENYDTGGTLALGTSYGDVALLSLGTTV